MEKRRTECCLYVSMRNGEEIIRKDLREACQVFGAITKLYLHEPDKDFAKVYFSSLRELYNALEHFSNSKSEYKVAIFKNSSNVDRTNIYSEASSVDEMDNSVFSKVTSGYVDLHGRDLDVLLSEDDNRVYVSLDDVKKSGFRIFPKERYNHLLVTKEMLTNELVLHLLSCAEDYLMINRVDISRDIDVANCIERAKKKLLGDASAPPQVSSPLKIEHDKPKHREPSNVCVTVSETKREFTVNGINDSKSSNKENFKSNGYTKNGPSNGNFNKENDIKGSKPLWNAAASSSENGTSVRMPRKSFDQDESKPENAPTRSNKVEIIRGISKIVLETEVQQLLVTHLEKENIIWVQSEKNEKVLEDIMYNIKGSESKNAENLHPGNLYLASYNDILCRVVLINTTYKKHNVFFIDFGNEEVVDSLKELPSNLSSIPGQAVRCALVAGEKVDVDQVFKAKVVKTYDDGTYSIKRDDRSSVTSEQREKPERKPDPVPETPPKKEEQIEATFFNVPEVSKRLKDNEIVILVSYDGGKFGLRTRELNAKFKNISSLITLNSALSLPSLSVGQLVLAKKERDEGLFRATVKSIDGDTVIVKYCDWNTVGTSRRNAMFNVTLELAREPAAIIESPILKNYKGFSNENEEFLDKLINNKTKLSVNLIGNSFDLILNEKSLSSLLFPSEKISADIKLRPVESSKPSPKTEAVNDKSASAESSKPLKTVIPSTPRPLAVARLMFEDMKSTEISPGKIEFMIGCFNERDDLTLINTDELTTDLLATVTDIKDYDDTPYEPIEKEMCLGFFDECYYRCVISQKFEDGKYEGILVDYGNIHQLDPKDIRKMPDSLKDIPMLGVPCYLTGLKNSKEINARLSKIIIPFEICLVEVLEYDQDKLQTMIKIPSIYETLQKEGFL